MIGRARLAVEGCMLRIEVIDDNCLEGEAWKHSLPLDTDTVDIMWAIRTLYPTATEVHILVEGESVR